ncbi:MAG: uracil-DNA glycosylase [Elusimicrobia bacterium]|nr:uracil-DNA glycosylase [Elusimicrobiota bacterium]
MRDELAGAARDLAAYIKALDDTLVEAGRSRPAAEVSVPPRPQPSLPAVSGDMLALAEQVRTCRKCGLGASRLNAVFGVGTYKARIVFVGEGPGFQEDHQGEPFVGRSGQLLDKIMETVLGLKRQDVYIANIVKCHPMKNPADPESRGNDRPPTPDEVAACRPYLDAQLRFIRPACIVTLGSVPTKVLLSTDKGISLMRGKWTSYQAGPSSEEPIRLMPTYHPAALLRNPNLKRDTWEDMKMVKSFLETVK